ncbi:MAG: hypothetical protein OEY59_12240, partial [Deltaproteobacteria bacterium]|nr:hypothetical protein [Deltaproteobacteria bacterium]
MGLDFASLKAFDHSGGIIFMLLVCILLLLWSRLKHPKHGFVVAFITGIFFTRCVFVLLNCFYDFMPLTQDAVRFNETMIDLANVLENNGIIAIKNKILNTYVLIPSFTLPYAVFYYLFGHTPMISFTLNTLLFAYLTFNVYRVGAMLYTKQAGVFAAIIYSLLPYSSIHSTYLYRDPLVNCILMEIFYQILIFFDNIKKRWIWIGFLFLLTALLRSENLVIFTAIFAIIMLKYNFEKITLLMPIRAIGVLFVLTMVTVYIFQNLDKSFVSIFAQLVDVEVLKERLHMNIIESSYLQDQTFNSYGDIFRYMPIRTIYFMFSPFPWDWFKIIQAIPFAEAMIILVFLLALPKAMKQQYKKRKIF